MRADARRNRELLLEAAAAAFAERGLDVSVAEIARRAGVGQGTVFRRFPTKADLMTAILVARLGELREIAEARCGEEDAWAALRGFMEAGTEMHARDLGLVEAVTSSAAIVALFKEATPESREELRAAHRAVVASAERLVDRAQAAGAVRADLSALDLPQLMCAAVQAAAPLSVVSPELWRRYLEIILAGLRPGAGGPLPVAPVTGDEFEQAVLGD